MSLPQTSSAIRPARIASQRLRTAPTMRRSTEKLGLASVGSEELLSVGRASVETTSHTQRYSRLAVIHAPIGVFFVSRRNNSRAIPAILVALGAGRTIP